jgi:hypothetical protein
LERLTEQIKEVGYMTDTNFVLHDLEEEHKEYVICYHNEKVARYMFIFSMVKKIRMQNLC